MPNFDNTGIEQRIATLEATIKRADKIRALSLGLGILAVVLAAISLIR
jgi:hypothetical protein